MPVVHVSDQAGTLRDVMVAVNTGCEAAWLIDHDPRRDWRDLNEVYHLVRDSCPDLWIGLNYLDVRVTYAAGLTPAGVDGLWSDDLLPALTESSRQALTDLREEQPMALFGSILFKGQPLPATEKEELDWLQLTAALSSVVTISGSRTGKPPATDVVKFVAEQVTPKPLALASGVTAGNLAEFYRAGARHFLVASSLLDGSGHIIPARLQELVACYRGLA